MGTQLQEHYETFALPARLQLPRVGRETIRAVDAAGRFTAVWLPSWAIAATGPSSRSTSLVLATGFAIAWFACLHTFFDATRLTLLALGPALGTAVGTLSGLVLVSAIAAWGDARLSAVGLAEMALGVFLLSWAWEALVHRSIGRRRRVLVIGAEDGGLRLAADVQADRDVPFDVVGVIGEEHVDTIAALVEARRPDIVVLASHELRPEAFERLLDVAGVGFKLVGLPEFYEHAFGRVPVAALRPTWFVNVLHLYQRPYTRLAKRCFDVVVASIGLLLTCWLFPILWLVVSRTPGPVIFRQTRLGEGGTHFTIFKFRTMRVDAEATGAVWAAQNDPRVTRAGCFMRKTRLDELPQLVNVLRGEMSIVGPRPERPEFLDTLRDTVPFWTRRHLVKPGITGWAQVRRGYTADAEGTADKLAYDLWYLRHRSLAIDVAICVKTFTTVVTGAGAR